MEALPQNTIIFEEPDDPLKQEKYRDIHEVDDNLYLSGCYEAHNKYLLEDLGITHIVNVTTDIANKFEGDYKYFVVPVEDLAQEDLAKYFEPAANFIDQALQGDIKEESTVINKVLVHCRAGCSRSPSIIIAYMIWKYHTPFHTALKKIK
ncbi:unnamed protein product [Moneuplotes crassus]|uniref:protein-serine/threonine phosphatase n=1 Tax=Euplotes crassus TaxID=5936 RepID=A0AAD1Y0F3_EUPCR|nr:unnamed protein product [Moneuplotes crassus]